MDSPPKRMTRARAAAKVTEATVKTTKIVTASARARSTATAGTKSTATAGTKSTAAKRKTRADEQEDEDEQHGVPATRRPRGRPRKADEPAEAENPAKAPRARVIRKTTTSTTTTSTNASRQEAAPSKVARGRPRKMVAAPAAEEPAAEPPKKTTRTRAPVTSTSSAASTAAKVTTTKALPKKSVKFQEPDKENIEPPEDKENVGGGLRGRPAKRGAAVSTRTTRAAVRTATPDPKPLSPKKITQIPVSRDDSEDELAGESTPVKPMMKQPIKPPTSAKKVEHVEPEETESTEETTSADTILNPPSLSATVLTSPARRLPSAPVQDTMRSPARRIGPIPLPGSTMKPTGSKAAEDGNTSPLKASLLQSAAKRPPSPIKGINFGTTSTTQHSQSAMKASLLQSPAKRSFPGIVPLTEPRQRDLSDFGEAPIMKPLLSSTPTPANSIRPSEKLMIEEEPSISAGDLEDDPFTEPMESLQFLGRLSAVLPRYADPVYKKDMGIVDEPEVEQEEDEVADEAEQITEELAEALDDDDMAVDDVVPLVEDEGPVSAESSSPKSPVEPENPVYQLRQKDMDPYDNTDSESDDEMEPSARVVPITPTKTPKSPVKAPVGGFTALAERFGSWAATSPVKIATLSQRSASKGQSSVPSVQASPHYFDDEMTVRGTLAEAVNQVDDVEEPPSDEDLMVTEEDVALAHEANEMSLLEPEVLETVTSTGDAFDDTLSEASQEYGDENQIPVDPAMNIPQINVPATPVRPVMKTFNTTTKVPLKPADDTTPSPLKKRSFTASRVAPKRPTGSRKSMPVTNIELASAPSTPNPVTPSKADLWSSMGTPARTPRRDVDPVLLRGAVVFVDVHTSEGADASSIFVELLTQMGAKCVKSWNWSPGSSEDFSSGKPGITHVVFKDGGKKTLERVRQTKGVVQCVGVSWVLDCERENEWLDEATYYINTKVVPRGGARRRKSMEPVALANMNGTLVSSPSKDRRASVASPITPKNRRQSSNWMYTPSEYVDDDMDDDIEWSNLVLTPVPKTPAPDAVARYAANLVPETPSAYDDDLDESPTKEPLLTRTCPPKKNAFRENAYHQMASSSLSPEKDDQMLVRLMAARRKSLQFAPKIGSPLARTWK